KQRRCAVEQNSDNFVDSVLAPACFAKEDASAALRGDVFERMKDGFGKIYRQTNLH
ncbi:hypothetical protein A2U01_0067242, partial [Trifolium medium]|nr:hypothetical protein [Trifolium medium]